MGKFGAAKNTNADDTKLQKSFNYLIDLLSSGYVAESIINGHTIRVSVDPKDGLMIMYDGVQIGGLAIVGDEITTITQTLTNDATDPAFWAKIGEVTVEGKTYRGILFYLKTWSTTLPFFEIACNSSSTTSGAVMFRMANNVWFKLSENTVTGDNEFEVYVGGASGGKWAQINIDSTLGTYMGRKTNEWAHIAILGIDDVGSYFEGGNEEDKTYFSSLSAGDHTHPDATTTESGFESAADKIKLDGISGSSLYIQDTAPVVINPSMWLETTSNGAVPVSLWLVTADNVV